jgi:Spy/CpxP family protein refolding chaperone
MKSKRVLLVGLALVLTLTAAVGISQTVRRAHMHGDGMFEGHMLHFFTDYLDLTDAQQAQVKDIMAKEKPAMQPLMQQMAQSRKQIHELAMAGNFDEGKVRTLASQQAQTMTEMIVQRARIESEMVQILTPEQKTKLNDFMATHEQRMMKHMQEQPQNQ